MVFRALGAFVARFWWLIPILWIAALAGVVSVSPPLASVVENGEFAFLPYTADSLVGERIYRQSFSKNKDFLGSSVVVVVRRDSRPAGLIGPEVDPVRNDRTFVENILAPRLRAAAEKGGWMLPPGQKQPRPGAAEPIVSRISTYTDPEFGPLLDSRDGKATLVRISLTTEYPEVRNAPLIDAIDRVIDMRTGTLREEGLIPAGLDLYMSGPAVVGKDMRESALASGKKTELATLVLVIGLLLLIYRAPVLAVIPLATVFVGTKIALSLLTLLAKAGAIALFTGAETYVTVVVYGAGVDYCMFLMARYKEELDAGASFDEAIATSLEKTGSTLAASAGTTIVGIGMMVFAEFGKFRQAGLAMSFSLVFGLLASLTFAPALMRLAGKWAFWPKVARERLPEPSGWVSPTRFASGMLDGRRLRQFWDWLAESITRRPAAWLLTTTALMLPLAVIGVVFHERLTYGLLDELPQDAVSVEGARAVQDHFPAGEAGPVTLLISDPNTAFDAVPGKPAETRRRFAPIAELTRRIYDHRKELSVADVRSLSAPFGVVRLAEASLVSRGAFQRVAQKYYVADTGPDKGHVTRLDVVFDHDPFSRNSIAQLDRLQATVRRLLPEPLKDAEIYCVGATASIRDLKAVTNRDQIRIDLMVLGGVYAVLIALLRQIAIAGYLIVTVFFSYLVTLGSTFVAFWAAAYWMHGPGSFVGLDWKVPLFLFTILVAVGEDYNIYLVARIEEEQRRLGGVRGVTAGLARTGGIISSCGLIMAGTFCSLMFGTLSGMIQLGFALAFGVILDTFVVRPILVPAYLVLLNDGSLGPQLSRWLGAFREREPTIEPEPQPSAAGR